MPHAYGGAIICVEIAAGRPVALAIDENAESK
jgi:hypothetical protein